MATDLNILEKGIEVAKEGIKETADTIKEGIKEIEEENATKRHKTEEENTTNTNAENISKHFQKQLMENNQVIEGYQKSLQNAYVQVVEYKIKEEVHGIVVQKIISFSDRIAKYNEEIENAENDIRRKKKKLQPLKDALRKVEDSINLLNSAYMDLNTKFETQISVMKKLKFEYKNDMDHEKYLEKYKREESVLIQLIDDISHKELQLLHKEHDRLHKVKELEPMLNALEEVEKKLEYLKSSQKRFISVEPHKMANLKLENQNIDKSDTSEVIDAQIYESSEFDTPLIK